ncbi:unnamed protein product [Porites evermanni]|uniref:Uncharacterized protein n=1 Tax=Porites evermanni TaxID=104178 RepID=A0ABN8S2N8_9CNID|nr:unnamed protein product [Porites evermanni]
MQIADKKQGPAGKDGNTSWHKQLTQRLCGKSERIYFFKRRRGGSRAMYGNIVVAPFEDCCQLTSSEYVQPVCNWKAKASCGTLSSDWERRCLSESQVCIAGKSADFLREAAEKANIPQLEGLFTSTSPRFNRKPKPKPENEKGSTCTKTIWIGKAPFQNTYTHSGKSGGEKLCSWRNWRFSDVQARQLWPGESSGGPLFSDLVWNLDSGYSTCGSSPFNVALF